MEKLTIGAVNSAHFTLCFWTWFAPTRLARLHDTLQFSDQSSRGERQQRQKVVICTAGFESKPNAINAIDTVLFQCDKKCKLLSTVTRLFCSILTRPLVYALNHNPPASIGYGGFLRGRSDLNIGASR